MIPRVTFDMFIDRPGVAKRVGRKKQTILAKTGGYGREVLRSLLNKPATTGRGKNKQKVSSKPGEPPRRIVGLIRKLTFFGVDRTTDTVVIAPLKFDQSEALDVLNEGGRQQLLMPGGKTVTATYEPRPYIEPVRPTVEAKFRENIETVPL